MNRNDLVLALIKALGVFFLASAIIEIPGFVLGAGWTAWAVIEVAIDFPIKQAFKVLVSAGLFTQFLTLALKAFIGLYLLGGGKWFYAKATKDDALAPR